LIVVREPYIRRYCSLSKAPLILDTFYDDMSGLQAPVALFPHDNNFDRPTSYYCWSRHVERVDRSRVWYPLAHDITKVLVVHLDSDLGQLSRRDHGLYAYLWTATD
jgi:hypothetical protein